MLEREKGTILIVGQSPSDTKDLSQLLIGAGFSVRVAIDGENTILEAVRHLPDLIILDILMAKVDGFDTCIKLKANPNTREIPVIFITSLKNTESKVKGLSLGAVDYITKPFDQAELIARVKVHFKLYKFTKKVIKRAAALQQINQELKRLADIDSLTQVANRRSFDKFLAQEWRRLRREQVPLSLILCDVDYFKQYNDYYGHLAGDCCLRKIAKAIKCTLKRPADLVARYGGEEFALILPSTNLSGALILAEMTRQVVTNLKITHPCSQISPYVTISLGVSSEVPNCSNSPKSLLTAADCALYEAKKQGRNIIISA